VRVIRGLPAAADVPVALTIGNFDGVHRGHQAMLARLIEGAEDLRLPPAVLTFDPHPREFFAPDKAPPRLSSLRARLDVFRALGVERTIVARFDARLAALTPEAFVRDVLERALDARWVLVGDDFRFGKGRGGDLAVLRANARQFSVEAMHEVGMDVGLGNRVEVQVDHFAGTHRQLPMVSHGTLLHSLMKRTSRPGPRTLSGESAPKNSMTLPVPKV